MGKRVLGIIFLTVILSMGIAIAKVNLGAPEININAASKKSVDFPHKTHQDTLKDCTICHSLFPMEKGVVRQKIDAGEMTKKTVMKECQGCHRKMKKAGQKTGPTSCGKCHAGK